MNQKNLHVLNGQCMYDYFKSHQRMTEGIYIPFNEAMCIGEVTEKLFSDDFISKRCKAHHISVEQYQDVTLKPLAPLLHSTVDKVVLWFDDDMFCQMNLLTLLAYLDDTNFKGEVSFHLVGDGFELNKIYPIQIEGYYNLYKQVLLHQEVGERVDLDPLEEGINRYLEWLSEENEIIAYIKKHPHEQEDILVQKLLQTFLKYGLGDSQYKQLIRKVFH